MADVDDLIARIGDPGLRGHLEDAVAELRKTRSYGLVFERHIPETVRLHDHPIRRGIKVTKRSTEDKSMYIVENISGESVKVRLVRKPDGTMVNPAHEVEHLTLALDQLTAAAEFGDPVHPGLKQVDSISRGGNRPSHVVIKGENYHVLEALRFTHAGKVDCIYIDPPYNTGARDWKYDNDYVDEHDSYRHSKWLAYMERRLKIAKDLLNPDDSVMFVTIDENELHRLGLLLSQLFRTSRIQMITSAVYPKGASLGRDFARVDEQILVVYIGDAAITPEVRDMLDDRKNAAASTSVKWSSLIRGGAKGIRTDSPGAYYPVFIDPEQGTIHSFGEALPWEDDRGDIEPPDGMIAVWPPQHPSGVEGRWGIGPETARELLELGALRLGRIDVEAKRFPFSYLSSGIMKKVESGEILTLGRKPDGSLIVRYPENTKITIPKTMWKMQSHNAGEYGSKLLSAMLPGRKFPFPKSLYAVEDTLRFFLNDKPNAVVLDFFAGSGTTLHAVARLNHQDDGHRQSILVTNNEVSVSESKQLRLRGLGPGDEEWEALGIFEHITRPRVVAAVTGIASNGQPVEGDYKFVDEFPIAEGFEENVEFFALTYEDPGKVELDMAFKAIARLLWMRAGAVGPILKERSDSSGAPLPHATTNRYGILFNTDSWRSFVAQLPTSVTTVFVVTDSTTLFSQIATELPTDVEPVRLYETYLSAFAINAHG